VLVGFAKGSLKQVGANGGIGATDYYLSHDCFSSLLQVSLIVVQNPENPGIRKTALS
jgi:hypothetical protein